MSYALVDSGDQKKLERFGEFLLVRPAAQALWKPALSEGEWARADARFTREGGNQWVGRSALPEAWHVSIDALLFKVAPTDFGHLGVFPEHSLLWSWMETALRKRAGARVLNLFAYSGGATLAAARAGAHVCHLDASKGMVAWARDNALLNRLEAAPIRWIVDDAMKFLAREKRRGVRYEGIILDPPSFGRGSQGEVFKVEESIQALLSACREVLSDTPLFWIFSTHTPGMSPLVMHHLLAEVVSGGKLETGEMVLPGERSLPCGSYARWCP